MGKYADVPELDGTSKALWTLLAMANHFVWGLQPVLTRWLQVRGNVSGMSLVCMAVFTSFILNVLTQFVCSFTTDSSSTESKVADQPKPWGSEHTRLALMVGFTYAMRSSSNFVSTSYTQAYNIAMIQMFGVFVMAFGSWLVLGEKVPRPLWLALSVCVIGSSMVLVGQSESADTRAPMTYKDAFGITLQIVSLLFSTGARLQMRMSDGLFTTIQFMRFQYLGSGAFVLLWCVLVIGVADAFGPWYHLSSMDWGIFFSLAVCIHFGAATLQVPLTRKLGVATYACFQPIRLVGAVVGSYFLLSEPVDDTLSQLGLVVVIATVTTYAIWKQKRTQKKPAPEE
eukprot:m.25930 g.25930  ORF g.25930 m.25930 type:complete len:341 (+) comp15222_c0_seq1:226-1248(+)